MNKINVIGKILLADEKQLSKIEKIFLMEEAKLNDGATVVVADPAFEAGASVMVKTEDGQEIPIPVSGEGEAYELEDGRRFTVAEEGVIAEVMEAGQEEEPVSEEGEEEGVAMDDNPTEQPLPKVVIESVVKEMKFSAEAQAKIDELETKLAEATKTELKEEEVVELKDEEVELQTIVHNPEENASTGIKFQWASSRKQTTGDKVMAKIAEFASKRK